MPSIIDIIAIYIAAVAAGFIGALLGLGGGIIMVPVLDMVFNFDIKEAAASSIVGVVGTAMMSSSTYIDKKIANVKLALTLTLSSIIGSFIGIYVIITVSSSIVRILFGVILIYSANYILKKQELGKKIKSSGSRIKSVSAELSGKFFDESLNDYVEYETKSIIPAVLLMFLSGFTASMFGVGGGIVNVPVIALVVGTPLKVAVATSTVIILFTATTSALLQLKYGYVVPWAAGTLFLGTITGSRTGAKIMNRLKTDIIRKAMFVALIYTGIRMILKGLGVPYIF